MIHKSICIPDGLRDSTSKCPSRRKTGTGNGLVRLPIIDLWGVGQLHYGSIWYRLAATHGNEPVWLWPSLTLHPQQRNKNLGKSNFLQGGLFHGPEIFSIDAPFMAAHFPPRLVWGPNPTELFPRNSRNQAHFPKSK